MSKTFPVGEHTYQDIRNQLSDYFGVAMPEPDVMTAATRETLEDEGYSVGQHRAAFHAFLRFLKDNLAGQTSIRNDGLWANQMGFLAGFSTAVPVTIVIKEEKLKAGLCYVETVLDITIPETHAATEENHIFPLSDIYARQTENLARKAYSADYTRFGFSDYAALET